MKGGNPEAPDVCKDWKATGKCPRSLCSFRHELSAAEKPAADV
jgi:hypothetical protein